MPGVYLLGNVGFNSQELPYLALQQNGAIIDIAPLHQEINLSFSTITRTCIGWGNLINSERFTCPENATIAEKYEQCPACQQRTGFNPAFYNATSISKQQEARNAEPHILYLAYFGPGVLKVGISHAKRGNARLLEQGARAAFILETFPTATLARQYEAKIAALDGIAETIQLRKKKALISSHTHSQDSAEKELTATQQRIEEALGVKFNNAQSPKLNQVFFPNGTPLLSEAIDCTDQAKISGQVIGLLGTLLFCKYNNELVYLPIKKFIGYTATFYTTPIELILPTRQMALF